MRLRHLAALAALIPATRVPAQRPVPTLPEIVAAWTAGGAISCQVPPRVAELPPEMRFELCTWPRVSTGREFGDFTGSRDANGVLREITWQRAVLDTAAAARIADSLSTALRAAGVPEYPCEETNRRWQQPGLTVQYTRAIVHRDGLLRLLIFATTIPNVLPEFACPGVPRLPEPPPRTPGSRIARRAARAAV